MPPHPLGVWVGICSQQGTAPLYSNGDRRGPISRSTK
uniref:Uncharacterized protein n=1 Tax=Anguilla anguilla TaxID=7936 RepID=A0A0E9R6J8_ANGAN